MKVYYSKIFEGNIVHRLLISPVFNATIALPTKDSLGIRSTTFEPAGPASIAVQQLDLHLVNVGSIPTGPTHGEV